MAFASLGAAVLLAACAAAPWTSAPAPVVAPVAAPATAAAASATAAERAALAPTGRLRVGVYPGSPSSLVTDAQGQPAGVAHDLGHALGTRLGVPVEVVRFERLALVVDAVRDAQVDFTFTNASAARARVIDFTEPLLRLELGYLVPATSPLQSLADVDRAGVRIGVSQGSSSQAALGAQLRQARLVPAASIAEAQALLRRGDVDAFATNKAILSELQQGLPGFRVLDGRWGLEHLAIAIPKGRDAARPFLQQFAREVETSGQLAAMVQRAGLRGMAPRD